MAQRFVALEIYFKDCMTMEGKGLYSPDLPLELYDHVGQMFVPLQIYL